MAVQISEALLYNKSFTTKIQSKKLSTYQTQVSMFEIKLMEQNNSTPPTQCEFLTSVMSTKPLVAIYGTGDIHTSSKPNYHKEDHTDRSMAQNVRIQSRLEVSIKNSSSCAHSIEWGLTWTKERRFPPG
jgi:hypothetical protein